MNNVYRTCFFISITRQGRSFLAVSCRIKTYVPSYSSVRVKRRYPYPPHPAGKPYMGAVWAHRGGTGTQGAAQPHRHTEASICQKLSRYQTLLYFASLRLRA